MTGYGRVNVLNESIVLCLEREILLGNECIYWSNKVLRLTLHKVISAQAILGTTCQETFLSGTWIAYWLARKACVLLTGVH